VRTDPRAACANEKENLWWALLHDGVAHPLMALTLYSKVSLRFHDFTSKHAWPRVKMEKPQTISLVSRRFGRIEGCYLGREIYSFEHPTVSHNFVTNARDAVEALEKAEACWSVMADEFGGKFLGAR
jgi:hypothetical protein